MFSCLLPTDQLCDADQKSFSRGQIIKIYLGIFFLAYISELSHKLNHLVEIFRRTGLVKNNKRHKTKRSAKPCFLQHPLLSTDEPSDSTEQKTNAQHFGVVLQTDFSAFSHGVPAHYLTLKLTGFLISFSAI